VISSRSSPTTSEPSCAPRCKDSYGDLADKYDGLSWHTDVTFVENPPLGSILNSVVIPAAGGDTMFSDQRAAYEGLSETLRDFLGHLVAVHDRTRSFGKVLAKRKDGGGTWEGKQYQALEPVVFVNPGFTSYIKGLTRAESDHLLRFLYDHSVKPQYTVRYHWHTGDLGFWGNRVTQHSVVGDFAGQHRVIQRVTLRGDTPV
jgi:alpha-ketoglutarate-dependent taurine dioxygenase